ncbi:MAG: OmpA family protein [Muribaculaceae bacterium]|nr:OmpA family protein [Muribaculaceae bacterium]
MKKLAILAIASMGVLAANAQTTAIEKTNFGSNWSIGLDGGVTTPLTHHAFFGSMRGTAGLHIGKQISPVFGVGVESAFGVNTSSWYGPHSTTAFDNSYVGAYGAVNLFNLFGGYNCGTRPFDIEAVLGAGWGHEYRSKNPDWNYFATKAGLNFNFNVSNKVTISLKPSVVWNMSDADVAKTSAAYNANHATFNCQVGLTYKFGNGFKCVEVIDPAIVMALNAQVNNLRGQLDETNAALAASMAANAALDAQLQDCLNRPAPAPTVIKETNNQLNSVRFVFFKIGSSVITADQQPNVEMIAAYLKNHPKATVEIKGYASADGPADINERLAAARAESVKNALITKYKVDPKRIVAKGEGIGHMFDEESWNRVSICTIENPE